MFANLNLSSSLEANVRLIALARLVLVCLAQVFVLLNHYYLGITISFFWAECFIALLACSAAFTFFQFRYFRTRSGAASLQKQVRFQLLSDVLILSLLFHVTGGPANPFVSILLFPLVVSASILPGAFTWLMVLLTLTCYGSLFWFGAIETASDTMDMHRHHTMALSTDDTVSDAFSLHVFGMWVNFAISAVLISFFVVRMRRVVDFQQQALNNQREQAMRAEQVLGIATQAASAAHHMGTPLSTMAVIIHDLQKEQPFPEAYKEDLLILAEQVAHCKQVLQRLRKQAENNPELQTVRAFMRLLIDEFCLMHPRTKLLLSESARLSLSDEKYETSEHEQGFLAVEPSLRMAILNVLNNAADASPDRVCLEWSVQRNQLTIRVTDFGEGFTQASVSEPIDSTKHEGLGIGLFLSHTSIGRAGGEIRLESSSDGGAVVIILLPLSVQHERVQMRAGEHHD